MSSFGCVSVSCELGSILTCKYMSNVILCDCKICYFFLLLVSGISTNSVCMKMQVLSYMFSKMSTSRTHISYFLTLYQEDDIVF